MLLTVKPNIVILSAFLSPFRSGAEAMVEEVAAEVADAYDITIITARLRKDLPRIDRLADKVSVVRVGYGSKWDKWLYPFLAPLTVRQLKPELIHAVLESYAGLAMIVCRLLGVPAKRLLTCQSTNTSFMVKAMHAYADRITVLSTALKERAASFGRTDAVIIPNGAHLHDIPEKTRIFGRVLFVGRLEPMKGIDTLLQAFAKLPEHASLHIVGDGSLRATLHAQATELGIADRVNFVGYLKPPAVYDEFAVAQVFCGLSRSEAFGNVFVEAQAAGCAVVATNVDGIPDIVTGGKTGLLVPVDDADAAAEAMDILLRDDEYRSELAEAGRQSAQRFSWSKIAREYVQQYDLLLQK